MPLTQQQIRDRLDSFHALSRAAMNAARDQEAARQQVEKQLLQSECAAIGHVFKPHLYGAHYSRLCAICDVRESDGPVVSIALLGASPGQQAPP